MKTIKTMHPYNHSAALRNMNDQCPEVVPVLQNFERPLNPPMGDLTQVDEILVSSVPLRGAGGREFAELSEYSHTPAGDLEGVTARTFTRFLRIARHALPLPALIFLSSCSSGNLAGGTSTETTNGIVILTSEGTPASGAFVSVVDGDGWIDSISRGRLPAMGRGYANDRGYVLVETTRGNRTVRVEFGDQSAIVSGLRDTVVLTKSVPLEGTAFGTDSVWIGGTDLAVPVNSDGTFRFESVPSGAVTLFCQRMGTIKGGGTAVKTGDSTVRHDLSKNRTDLLFDDFTGGFDLNPISPVTGGVEWYTFCDSIHKSYRNGVWKADSLSFHSGNSTISAEMKSGIALPQIVLGSAAAYPYAGLGADLGTVQRGFNLSKLTAVTFRIRGTGVMRIRLASAQLDSLGISGYSAKIPLDSNWNTIRIPVDSFHLDAKDESKEVLYPWRSGASDIRRMEFLCRGTENRVNSVIRFEIDEIWWEGVTFPF